MLSDLSIKLPLLLIISLFILSCNPPSKKEHPQADEAKLGEVEKRVSPEENASAASSAKVNGNWTDENGDPVLFDGDIIFQTSGSGQSKAIQLATHSKYSHVGMILNLDGEYYVYEAIQPVSITPIESFIARGDNKHYVIKRVKETDNIMRPDVIEKIKKDGMKYKDKDYDLYFGWTDDKIYCSELVYKIYKEYADVELGKLQKLKEFDLSSPLVKAKLRERYGNNIPMDESVISPAAIFDDPQLFTVLEQ